MVRAEVKHRIGLPALLMAMVAAFPAAAADTVQGIVRAAEEALLSSEMAGRILRLPLEPGQGFRKGDTLVEFSCDSQRAEEDMARAVEQGAHARLDTARKLDAARSAGALDLALAEAAAREGAARVRAAAAKAAPCRVVAPYDGIVLTREVRTHESVNAMAPLLRIGRKGMLEIEAIVPSAWLASLKPGTKLSFAASTLAAQGKVIQVGAAIDPASQTAQIRGQLETPAGGALLPGTAGLIQFQP